LTLDTERGEDFLDVQVSHDGQSWTTVERNTGTFDRIDSSSIPASFQDDSSVYFRFRLRSDAQVTADGARVHAVLVPCFTSRSTYQYLNGTSFSTPHVAGAAALVAARYPNANVAEIRSRILNGVDQKPGLVGKVATGGRLNAERSLAP
jgi:subtilisin family serine protease